MSAICRPLGLFLLFLPEAMGVNVASAEDLCWPTGYDPLSSHGSLALERAKKAISRALKTLVQA